MSELLEQLDRQTYMRQERHLCQQIEKYSHPQRKTYTLKILLCLLNAKASQRPTWKGQFRGKYTNLVSQRTPGKAIQKANAHSTAKPVSVRHTRKHASTALKRLRSMSAPATTDLLTILRLWHTANICFRRLLHRSGLYCREAKAALCTGSTPCRFACRTGSIELMSGLHNCSV